MDDIDAAKRALDIETRTIRFKMGQRIDQKYVPQIRFTYDDTLERAERIEELLESVSVSG